MPQAKSPQGKEHDIGVVTAADLGGEHRGEGLLFLGPAPADADFLPRLGVGDHDLRQKWAGREDRKEHAQAIGVAVEEGRGRERAADRGDEPPECHKHAIWIAHRWQERGQAATDRLNEVKREAVVDEVRNHPAGDRGVGEPGRPTPCDGSSGIVEKRTATLDIQIRRLEGGWRPWHEIDP